MAKDPLESLMRDPDRAFELPPSTSVGKSHTTLS
jgi:hypothetical protein